MPGLPIRGDVSPEALRRLARRRLPRGQRPRMVKDQRYRSSAIFGAVCPERDTGAPLALPEVSTAGTNPLLAEIARQVPERRHAMVLHDLANGLAFQPGAPGDHRHAGALPMQIQDHDNLSRSSHRLPASIRGKPRRHSASRPPLNGRLRQPTWGIFSRRFWGVLQRR